MKREAQIEMLCTYLGASEVQVARWKTYRSGATVLPPTLGDFDGVEPLWGIDGDGDPDYLVPLFIPPKTGLDVSIAATEPNTGDLCLRRIRLLSPREARGVVPFARFIKREWIAFIDRDGTCRNGCSNAYSLSSDGANWRGAFGGKSSNEIDGIIPLVSGIGWRRERTWRVIIGFDGAPTVNLETSPSGVREVFALRDIPNGKKRRAALRHWVTGHWRIKGGDDSDALWVRKHLRGATSFSWNGMRGNITVPTPEMEAERVADIAAARAKDALDSEGNRGRP